MTHSFYKINMIAGYLAVPKVDLYRIHALCSLKAKVTNNLTVIFELNEYRKHRISRKIIDA